MASETYCLKCGRGCKHTEIALQSGGTCKKCIGRDEQDKSKARAAIEAAKVRAREASDRLTLSTDTLTAAQARRTAWQAIADAEAFMGYEQFEKALSRANDAIAVLA